MLRAHKIDATKGPILINLIRFALPIAIGSLIQNLFSSADMTVLGNFADSTAVASIGAAGVISSLLVNFSIGLSAGVQVVFAQAVGERNSEKMKKTVSTSMVLSLIVGVLIAIIGFIVSRPLLVLTECPSECISDAEIYLQISFICIIPSIIYNFGMSLIRAYGDTQRPLYYMIAMGVLNVILNFILCLIMTNKVAAVAIATLASQVLGVFLVIFRLIKSDDDCKLTLSKLSFDLVILKKILLIGVPQAITIAMFPLSNLQIQSAINSFGPSTIAGNSTTAIIEGWIGSFTSAIHNAIMTFMGQNIGARKPDRIRKTFIYGVLCGTVIGTVLGVGIYALGRPILRIFLPEDLAAVEIGILRMQFIVLLYGFCFLKGTPSTGLQSFGYAIISTINGIFSTLVLRIIWMNLIYPHFESINNIYLCYVVSWMVEAIIGAIAFAIIYKNKIKQLSNPIEKAVI